MRILVTGSEGSLMQFVIPHLLKNGHEVVGVDNFARYGEIERERNYEFVRGDLTDPSFVDEIMKNSCTLRLGSEDCARYLENSRE